MSNEMFNCVGSWNDNIDNIQSGAAPAGDSVCPIQYLLCQEIFICKEITNTMNADKNTQ